MLAFGKFKFADVALGEVSICFSAMLEPKRDIMTDFAPAVRTQFRKLVTDLILETDMCSCCICKSRGQMIYRET